MNERQRKIVAKYGDTFRRLAGMKEDEVSEQEDEQDEAVFQQVRKEIFAVLEGLEPGDRAEILDEATDRWCMSCGEEVPKKKKGGQIVYLVEEHECEDDEDDDEEDDSEQLTDDSEDEEGDEEDEEGDEEDGEEEGEEEYEEEESDIED